MSHRVALFLVASFVMVIVAPAPASAGPLLPVGPVLNGGFELAAYPARGPLCEVFGPTYINVFEPGNPLGLPWLASVSPCHAGAVKALGWSSGMTSDVGDFDADGDREVRFLPGVVDPQLGSHNLWQAYPNPHQAWVADFTELRFRVEGGAVPPGALVQVSLSETPLSDASPWVGIFIDCFLTFLNVASQVGAGGVVMLDPVEDAVFSPGWSGCDDEAAAFNAPGATPADKLAVLSKLRFVQHSYWHFASGPAPVTIDDVEIVGARTVVESAAGGALP
jgi:hypothetical protein